MAEGQTWTFRQLGGPKRTIQLTGWAAPFGRARKQTIVTDGIELRKYTRRYPGNDEPTNHIFGVKLKPWELSGRWMDSASGPGFAKAMETNMRSFVADAQRVGISWGRRKVVVGLITGFDAGSESETDVTWNLTIEIQRDVKLGARPDIPKPVPARTYTDRIVAAMNEPLEDVLELPPTLQADFLGFLDGLVALINAPGAALNDLADQLNTLKTGTIAAVRRFRAGIEQFRGGLFRLRTFYESAPSELALEFQDADRELELATSQAAYGKTMAQAMREVVKAQRDAARAQRSQIRAIYTANQGDTWEAVSIRVYGTAGRVADILEANGLTGGSQPQSGTSYILPA